MHEHVGVDKWGLNYLHPNKPTTETFTLLKNSISGHFQGKIIVEMVYKPFAYYTTFEDVCPLQKAPIGTPQGGGLFVVIVHECSIVQGKHHTNPFVSILFRGELRKTVVRFVFLVSLVLHKFRSSFTFFFLDFCSL